MLDILFRVHCVACQIHLSLNFKAPDKMPFFHPMDIFWTVNRMDRVPGYIQQKDTQIQATLCSRVSMDNTSCPTGACD